MYNPNQEPCFGSAPSASGASPWVAPGHSAGRVGPAIGADEAALWRLLDYARPVLRGTLLLAWSLLALSAWLLLVLALPMAVLSPR